MSNADFDALKNRFREYAVSFADSPGKVPQAMQLKIGHTFDVCSITDYITEKERSVFDARGRYLARLAALFHDVSRFKQYKEFQTFRDADSFDHGEMSAENFKKKISIEKKWEEE